MRVELVGRSRIRTCTLLPARYADDVFGSAVMMLRTLSCLSSPPDDSISRVRCHAWLPPTLSLLYIFSLLLLRQDVYRSVFVDCVQTTKINTATKDTVAIQILQDTSAKGRKTRHASLQFSLLFSASLQFLGPKRQLERTSAPPLQSLRAIWRMSRARCPGSLSAFELVIVISRHVRGKVQE